MRITPLTKAILILIIILAVWIGGGIFIYNHINPPAQTPTTTLQTTTPTTTTPTPTTTTPTPTSNLSESEQNYIAKISDHSPRVIAAITSLSELLSSPQLDDATWISQTTAQTETLKSLYDEMVQVSTPLSLLQIHYSYTYGLSVYKSAANYIDQAITEQDVNYILQAISFINSGTNIISSAIDALNDFIAEYS